MSGADYIYREISSLVLMHAQQYPLVALMGPRQSGKTTLVKHLFADKPYINLEDRSIRQLILQDPKGFLAAYPEGAILDEVQKLPELLSYLQLRVDVTQRPGEFILTGSHQLMLHEAITQSLAGRVSLLTLLPFNFTELFSLKPNLSLNDLLFRGFYPRVHEYDMDPVNAYRNYYQTYVERDVREIMQVQDLNQFDHFVRLLAARTGQILNLQSLGNDLGLSHNTLKKWLSILEASYIVMRLYPYHGNIGKRLVKSPKIYFYDCGLAAYLLGIESVDSLQYHPLRGHLFENMIVSEIVKARLNQGHEPHLFFYRDQGGHEVDLLLQKDGALLPIEIKVSQTFNPGFLKEVTYVAKLLPNSGPGFMIYSGEPAAVNGVQLLNYLDAAKVVSSPKIL